MKSKASGCVGLISRWIKLREWMYSIQEIWLKVWENEREYQIRSNEPADLQVEEQWTCDCRNWKDLREKVQPFLLVSVQSFNESMILKPVLSLPKKRPNSNINQKSTKLLQVALVSLSSNGMRLQCSPHFFSFSLQFSLQSCPTNHVHCNSRLSYFCITESPSPDTPGLSYSPSTTDSSETRTVQMMFKDDCGLTSCHSRR